MMQRRILLILRRPPYHGVQLAEALDALLVGAAFDQPCAVLLIEDAVFALAPGQDGSLLGMRTAGKLLRALPDYEVKEICACSRSLAERNLTEIEPVVPVRRLSPAEQAEYIAGHDVVWND